MPNSSADLNLFEQLKTFFANYDYSSINIFEELLVLAWYVLLVVGFWRVFKKAGQPGWAALIPVYNFFVFYKIATGRGWYFLFLLIPIFGFIFNIQVIYRFCRNFGKGKLFSAITALLLFTIVVIGFDKSVYNGPLPSKRRA